MTAVTPGSGRTGCVAETMQSRIGVPNSYSLSITERGRVTLTSASGDYSCSFTPSVDSSGFTTYGVGGTFTCKDAVRPFRCDDGTMHRLFSWGQDISGRVSGTEISGTWDANWEDMGSGLSLGSPLSLNTKAEFTGKR
jgi:hypothetical protein